MITPTSSPPSKVKIAACHVSPVYLDPSATVTKAITLIAEAASNGANLVVFPEAFIPGFPLFAAALAPVDHGTHFSAYVSASIYADGPEMASLRETARTHAVAISIGFSERSRASSGCIWNSNMLLDADGAVLVHHRKLVPTFYEKLVWSPGDGFGLRVAGTMTAGRVGALICGENTNPLARYALMAQDEWVHVASFPPAWPTRRATVGGYANRTANAVRGAAHSFEAKCFTCVCAAFLDQATRDKTAAGNEDVMEVLSNATQGATQFFGPDGVQMGDELTDTEGLAYAECDVTAIVEAKKLHDLVGGYNRYDVFDLTVTRKRDEPVQFR